MVSAGTRVPRTHGMPPLCRDCCSPPQARRAYAWRWSFRELGVGNPKGIAPLLQRKPAVDQIGLSGRVARLVRRQEHSDSRDLLGGAETAHRLAVDELLADFVRRLGLRLCQGGDAVVEG